MQNIAIIGAGGHAKVLIDIVESRASTKIAGLIGRQEDVGGSVMGHAVLGSDDDLIDILSQGTADTVLIGLGDPAQRMRLHDEIVQKLPNVTFGVAVHKQAYVSPDVVLGPGTVIMAGATVNPCCRIGAHCVVNTNASMDHDSAMGDFSNLGPNAATGGNVRIGKGTVIGLGASINQGVAVGDNCIVGSGSVVLRNVVEGSKVAGVPAQLME